MSMERQTGATSLDAADNSEVWSFSWQYGLPVLVAVLWGSLPLANRLGVTGGSPLGFSARRALLASVLMALLLATVRGRSLGKQLRSLEAAQWRPLVLVGLLQTGVFFAAVSIGVLLIPSGQAAVVLSTQTPLTALLAHAFLRERLGRRRALGVAVAFACIPLVASAHLGQSIQPVGILVLLIAASSWSAAALVYKRYLAGRLDPLLGTAVQLWVGTVFLVIIVAFWEPAALAGHASRVANAALLYSVIFGTCVPYVLWFALLKRMSASRLTSFTFLMPVVGVLLGRFIAQEPLGITQALGALGAIVGLALIVL